MGQFSVNVVLPPTWEQVPNDSRAFRRRGVAGGVLRISLQPPISTATIEGQVVSERLASLLSSIDLDVGEEVTSYVGSTPLGPAATSLRKSQQQGLLQYWLIGGQVTVFASYTMGQLAEAQQDLTDAQGIMSGLQIVQAA